MKKERFSIKTLTGVTVSSSMRLKAIDVINGEVIATVLDDDNDEWVCEQSKGDASWQDGHWLQFSE